MKIEWLLQKKGVPFGIVLLAGLLTGSVFSLTAAVPVAALFLLTWLLYATQTSKELPVKGKLARDARTYLPFFILVIVPVVSRILPPDYAIFTSMPRNVLLTLSIAGFIALKLLWHPKKIEIKHTGKIVVAAAILYFLIFQYFFGN